jgi:3'(2'), 5'-bisphosphate nucleotidase
MMVAMEKELTVAKKLALAAGDILMEHYVKAISVDWKAPGDPVTEADRAASTFIVSNLKREFPTQGILSEEECEDPSWQERQLVWMIDPMDGTREFIDHREDFAVQIGLVQAGIPVLGVVYQPVKDKLYYAAEGMGAFLKSADTTMQLHVSAEHTASRMTMAMSRSHRSARVDAIREQLHIDSFIQMGSVGLKVGLICEGRAHLYVHTGGRTHLWDTCAPEAILREAGGHMSDVSNQPLRYDLPEHRNLNGLVATNGVIHDRVVEVTQAVLANF